MIILPHQADWRALRGALVGCLALMRRKSCGGMVSGSDAKAVAESYLQNLQVQSLGQYERKVKIIYTFLYLSALLKIVIFHIII